MAQERERISRRVEAVAARHLITVSSFDVRLYLFIASCLRSHRSRVFAVFESGRELKRGPLCVYLPCCQSLRRLYCVPGQLSAAERPRASPGPHASLAQHSQLVYIC